MSNQNGTEPRVEKLRSLVTKPSFFDLCKKYNVDYNDMLAIAQRANVPIKIIQTMFVGKPVKRAEAIAVLGALSDRVPESWTMDNTTIPTLPESEGEQHE
jgi:hypothetical protein